MSSPRQRSRYRQRENTGQGLMQKMIAQACVCGIIIVLVVIVKAINTPYTQGISNNIKNSLYYMVDYKQTTAEIFEKVKQIPQMWNKDAKENEHVTDGKANQEPQPTGADNPVQAD